MTTPPDQPSSPGDPNGPAGPGGTGQEWQPQWQPQYNPQYPAGGYPPGPIPGYGWTPPEHPKAQTALILGILGLVLCQIAAPFAWSIGKRTVAEIDASGGQLGGRSQAQTGYVLGIVGTVLLGLAVAFLIFYFVIFLVLIGGMAATAP